MNYENMNNNSTDRQSIKIALFSSEYDTVTILTIHVISRQKDRLQTSSQIAPLGVDLIQSRRVPLKYIRRRRTYTCTYMYAHMYITVYPVLDVLWRGVLGSCGAYQDEG